MANTRQLPGMPDAERVEEIETAVEAYCEMRDERMKLGKKEQERKKALRDVMHKLSVRRYALEDGRVAELTKGEEELHVRKPKGAKRAKKGK